MLPETFKTQEPVDNNKSNLILNASNVTGTSTEDLASNTYNSNYYIKNKTPSSKTKPYWHLTPQHEIKMNSTEKPFINMAQSNTIKFPSADCDAITKYDQETKEITNSCTNNKDDDFSTNPTHKNCTTFGRVAKSNDIPFNNNFRQNQEYWQDISAKSLTKQLHNNYQQKSLSDKSINVVNKQHTCQKQTKALKAHKETHTPDINSKCTHSNEQQQKYMQISNFHNFDKHKFPSHSSGLSNNNIGVTTTCHNSVDPFRIGRIHQPSPATSPLMIARRTMKFIQKRSDETSCGSSFEQLNIIGIPTTSSTTHSLHKQATTTTKAKSSSSSQRAINNTENQTNSNYDFKFGINSMERMKYSSGPLPKLPIENMVSLIFATYLFIKLQ